MDIFITAWALDSYLDLKHAHVLTDQEYKTVIRPDVMLLKTYPQSANETANGNVCRSVFV